MNFVTLRDSLKSQNVKTLSHEQKDNKLMVVFVYPASVLALPKATKLSFDELLMEHGQKVFRRFEASLGLFLDTWDLEYSEFTPESPSMVRVKVTFDLRN